MSSKCKAVAKTAQQKRKVKLKSYHWQLYSMCALPILLVFIFKYLPMGGIILAFKNYKFNLGIFRSPWVGFDNFEFFVKSDVFFQLVRNTICNNLLFIIVQTFCSILVAILLYEITSRNATKIFQTLMITPHFMSWVVAAYMVYAILNTNYGYLNQVLNFFGMDSVDWYSKPNAWPAILTVTNVWKHVGMDSVIYYAALMGLDSSLFEAAAVDGANKFQRTIHIMLPSLVTLIVIQTILKIGSIFHADFGLFYTVTQDGANGNLYSTTNVIDTYIFRTFKQNTTANSYGLTSAVGLLQSIVGMIVVLTANGLSKKIDKDLGLF